MTPQETALVDELSGLLIIHQFTPSRFFLSLSLYPTHRLLLMCSDMCRTIPNFSLTYIVIHLHAILKIPAASPSSLFYFNQRVS